MSDFSSGTYVDYAKVILLICDIETNITNEWMSLKAYKCVSESIVDIKQTSKQTDLTCFCDLTRDQIQLSY